MKKPGDKLKLQISRNGATQDIEAELGKNFTQTYNLQVEDSPTALQTAILKDWLRAAQ